MPEIVITPGGFISSKPRHKIGMRGASPFITNPLTIEGFQNLVAYHGDVAFPIMNSASDNIQTTCTNFLGNDAQGAQDNVDVVFAGVMSTIAFCNVSDSFVLYALNNSGEFCYNSGSATQQPNVGSEKFTTAGTITVAAASNIVTGAGTTWTTNVLTGPYGLTPSMNKIYPGDILRVEVNAGRFISFRITSVTDNTHVTIYPTPTAGNPAIGAGLAYTIWRTGFNSNSRYLAFADATVRTYMYYCGGRNIGAAPGFPHGTIQCVKLEAPANRAHYMAPQTVDSSGAAVADIQADDLAYYKGFILYGAGPSVSWSVAGAPTTLPFGTTDFPAKNISIVDAFSEFVSFEYLGDQVIALFEDSSWLVTATGSVPEFAFYKLPELITVNNPSKLDTSGSFITYGRPSASGRGAIYYTSNRGLETLGGSLAQEASAPISNTWLPIFGTGPVYNNPLYVGWDVGTDTTVVRRALNGQTTQNLLYNPATNDWSTFWLLPIVGGTVAAVTPGVQPVGHNLDHARLVHLAYYETVVAGGVAPTNGGNIRPVTGLMDLNIPTVGLFPWEWLTPVVPLGQSYPDFSMGGFVFDAYSHNSAPVTVDWTLYGGSSPYNLFVRDSNTMTFDGSFQSPWISSRQRLAKKFDDAFTMLKFSSTYWVAPVAVTLFEAQTPAMR